MEPSLSLPANGAAEKTTEQEPPIPKRRSGSAKLVSFAEDALSRDRKGDGTGVVVEEEQGVFVGPLLGRVSLPTRGGGNHRGPPAVSFGGLPERETSGSGGGGVEFENLAVRMGLLKCGHRYRLVIPVPDHRRNTTKTANQGGGGSSCTDSSTTVRIIEDSLDDDLTGEIERKECLSPSSLPSTTTSNDGCDPAGDRKDSSSSSTLSCRQHQYFLKITLAPSRRGPYRGRFALESVWRGSDHDPPRERPRRTGDRCESDGNGSSKNGAGGNDESESNGDAGAPMAEGQHPAPLSPVRKCVMSVQVDATVMGKDTGTPKLRNGVVCLGKVAGYDSDENTEWQGFG